MFIDQVFGHSFFCNIRSQFACYFRVLLRRGADPSISDWPLPVLALAVRAGDKEMVELLLKKKAQVNCRLNAARHVHLTPLHIACGCLSPNSVDIVRLLLKYGANVNAQTLPGGKEYLSLADPVVLDSNKIVNSICFRFLEKKRKSVIFRLIIKNMVVVHYISLVLEKHPKIHWRLFVFFSNIVPIQIRCVMVKHHCHLLLPVEMNH